MKEKLKILLSGFIVGAVSFLMFHMIGCSTDTQEKEIKSASVIGVSKEEEKSCCSTEMDESGYSENSIYQLDSQWEDQSGKKVKLSGLKGDQVVLTMFFASCTYACPVLVNDMKKIEAKMNRNELKNTRFILVSIDPERDTPAALKEFAAKYNLDLKRWTLLSGKKDDVQDLAAVLGFKYKKEENGDYSHSNLINILDTKGEVIHQHTGLNQDITAAAKILNDNNNL